MKKLLFLLLLLPVFSEAQIITTIVGNGLIGHSGDGGPADSATIWSPSDVKFDRMGNMYIADYFGFDIRKVNILGIITTLAVSISSPQSLAIDSIGNVYCGGPTLIRKIDTSGVVTIFAGNGSMVFNGDNIPATSAAITAGGIAFDKQGNLYIADGSNYRVRKIDGSGMITTIAGIGIDGYSGDGGPASAAMLEFPNSLTFDDSGNLFICDTARIRKINAAGIISTVAGGGSSVPGDGGLATTASIIPCGIAVDHSGNIYFSEESRQKIRKIGTDGIINTLAGTGVTGYSGDGGPASAAKVRDPSGLALDPFGNVCFADAGNNRIRRIDLPLTIVPLSASVEEIYIYPNPAITTLTISSSGIITALIITNLLGQTVHSQKYNSPQVQVDVSNLPSGIYFIKVNGSEVRKFVKE